MFLINTQCVYKVPFIMDRMTHFKATGLRGATVARLTPDQKVACSNHVAVTNPFFPYFLVVRIQFYFYNT